MKPKTVTQNDLRRWKNNRKRTERRQAAQRRKRNNALKNQNEWNMQPGHSVDRSVKEDMGWPDNNYDLHSGRYTHIPMEYPTILHSICKCGNCNDSFEAKIYQNRHKIPQFFRGPVAAPSRYPDANYDSANADEFEGIPGQVDGGHDDELADDVLRNEHIEVQGPPINDSQIIHNAAHEYRLLEPMHQFLRNNVNYNNYGAHQETDYGVLSQPTNSGHGFNNFNAEQISYGQNWGTREQPNDESVIDFSQPQNENQSN